MIRKKHVMCLYVKLIDNSRMQFMKLGFLINHLNDSQFRWLQRWSNSVAGYAPFRSFLHLSCVTFSLLSHIKGRPEDAESLSERISRGSLKVRSQHSTTLNHARLVLTFHIRWKNSSCSARIAMNRVEADSGDLSVIYGSLTSFYLWRTNNSEDGSGDHVSLVSVSSFFAPAHLTPHHCCISLLNPH